MNITIIEEILEDETKLPQRVKYKDIQEYDRYEERYFDVYGLMGPIIEIYEDSIEFCPQEDYPTRDEILAWLWLIHPEWKEGLIKYANEDLKKLIVEYIAYPEMME